MELPLYNEHFISSKLGFHLPPLCSCQKILATARSQTNIFLIWRISILLVFSLLLRLSGVTGQQALISNEFIVNLRNRVIQCVISFLFGGWTSTVNAVYIAAYRIAWHLILFTVAVIYKILLSCMATIINSHFL